VSFLNQKFVKSLTQLSDELLVQDTRLSRTIELVHDARCTLGEAPRYVAREHALYWVDIPEAALWRLDLASGVARRRVFAESVVTLAARRSGGLLLAMASGFALLDHFEATPVAFGPRIDPDRPDNRLNDGRCDAEGRFFIGSMNKKKPAADGGLFRLDPDGSVDCLWRGALTANGIAFSPDGAAIFLSDTPQHATFRAPYDPSTGAIGAFAPFAQFPLGKGRPDGGSVDQAGDYWAGLYDGGRVVRLSPQGALLEEIPIPARHVTMIAFGGRDWRTAYVTTARQATTDEELSRFPHAGGVFAFEVDMPGLPEPLFAG